jgi:hypothetical protein
MTEKDETTPAPPSEEGSTERIRIGTTDIAQVRNNKNDTSESNKTRPQSRDKQAE